MRKTKQQHVSDLLGHAEELLTMSIILENDPDEAEELGSEEEEDEMAELLELQALMEFEAAISLQGDGTRGPYNTFMRSTGFFSACLSAPDRVFRHTFRLGRDMFEILVDKLASNTVFQSSGKKPQRHIKYQLAAFLMRYGQRGSDSLEVATKLGIGHGTVHLYCRRVIRAIRELRPIYLNWGSPERRREVAQAIEAKSGFPNCVGSGDGMHVQFTDLPLVDGVLYFGRKKFVSTNLQATVEDRRLFTSFELGWPGSVTDVKIFKSSHLWKNRRDYFKNGEYILVDKGYISSPYTIRPFDEPEVRGSSQPMQQRMRAFNKRLSGVRIEVEHAFGMLKGRFRSLKELGPHQDIQDVYRVIEALMVLHNMCIIHDDRPEDIWDFDPSKESVNGYLDVEDGDNELPDEHEDIPQRETNTWLKEQGKRKRDIIFNDLFPE